MPVHNNLWDSKYIRSDDLLHIYSSTKLDFCVAQSRVTELPFQSPQALIDVALHSVQHTARVNSFGFELQVRD